MSAEHNVLHGADTYPGFKQCSHSNILLLLSVAQSKHGVWLAFAVLCHEDMPHGQRDY